MKKFPKLLLGIIISVSLLIGCAQSKEKQTSNSLPQLPSSPFNTDNRDLIFAQIEAAVDSVIKMEDIDYQEGTIKGYLTWDSITKAKYSPNLYSLSTSSDWAKHNNGIIEYLNWHLRKVVYKLLDDNRIVTAMNEETALTDSLLATQYKFLRSHFDSTQEDLGTSSNLKYYDIEVEMLELQNKNLRELLEALTDSKYNKTVEHRISSTQLENEYRHLHANRIPYYRNDSVYNMEDDEANLKAEIASWNKLMIQRGKIATSLHGRLRTACEIGTYNLMFNRLRQLKNEYEAYGLMSGDMRENLLTDSCTYEELLAYTNFSTKWNEYLKQFK